MAQNDFAIPNQGGQAFRLDVQDALQSLAGHSSGATDPNTAVGTTYPYQFWADTNNSVMKMRNGADTAWIELFQLDGEWSTIAFENGTAAAPSIYFKDSGTDTGFYSPGANQVGISTGGTSALVVDASQRVGIGSAAPSTKLEIRQDSAGSVVELARLNNNAAIASGKGARLGFGLSDSSTASPRAYVEAALDAGNKTHLAFATHSGSTLSEGARLDGDGRLGIGLTNPSNTLHLAKEANHGITLERTVSNPGSVTLNVNSFGAADFKADNTFNIQSGTSAPIIFSTSGTTERLRITSGGILNLNGQRSGFGTPMSGSGNVRVAAASAGGIALNTFDTVDYTAVQFVREVSGVAQQVGTITCTSTNTAYNETSDYRLKENVVPLTGAVDRLNQLQVHRFNFIIDPDKTVDGFLAHEVQAVVPECATGTKDEVDADGNPVYQGIDKSKLVPLLTAALQEALAEIESLKARVAALEP